ncbi:phosphogluconate dehydratase [Labrys neptuniae]
MHPVIEKVTAQIIARSRPTRMRYLERIARAADSQPRRKSLGCANLAHGFAACGVEDKGTIRDGVAANIGIVTAYNDMLSAHQPFERYPALIKQAAREAGAVAQVAGGVPAMCDGITQGEAGMELSLFSRDVIALATGVALSHQMFDAALYLGVCDKIVPGLIIGALSFGHLPALFIPAGPMPSGLPNDEKSRARQLHAQGQIDREGLLEAEARSYHAPGTCTFYGTANTNQMLMEIMGLHVPGTSFIQPDTPLREAATKAAVKRVLEITNLGDAYTPLGHVLDERAFVNGMVGLNATGGSTNLTIHLIAMAAAAGIVINWADLAEISNAVPLLARVYPNGPADVNRFHAVGGMGFLIRELIDAGLLHKDVSTSWGTDLDAYAREAVLEGEERLTWRPAPALTRDPTVLRGIDEPFSPTGGLSVLNGNLGEAVAKISAVKPEHQVIEAPVLIFHSQEAVQKAFKAGELNGDHVIVVRFQGPKASGMPELHKLMPALGVLQQRGFKVALLTDGRLSGASGKVLAALHMTPEAADGGPIARLQDGDIVRIDAAKGSLEVLAPQIVWGMRKPAIADLSDGGEGVGRELFSIFRAQVGPASHGASIFGAFNLEPGTVAAKALQLDPVV